MQSILKGNTEFIQGLTSKSMQEKGSNRSSRKGDKSEPRCEKTGLRGFRHKPGCTTIDDG